MFIHARARVLRARPSEHCTAGVSRVASFHSRYSTFFPHVCTNASLILSRRHEMQRHLWARGTSEPFTGHQRILAFCAVGSANPPLQPHFVEPIRNKIGFSAGSRKMGCSIVYDLRCFSMGASKCLAQRAQEAPIPGWEVEEDA